MMLTGNLTGIPSRKPIGFFPVFPPSPRRGEENRKTEVGISGQGRERKKKEDGNARAAAVLAPARALAEVAHG